MSSSNNIFVNALHNFERVFGFSQLITEHTRVSNNSESAIEKVCQLCILRVGISENLITYCTRKVNRAPASFECAVVNITTKISSYKI